LTIWLQLESAKTVSPSWEYPRETFQNNFLLVGSHILLWPCNVLKIGLHIVGTCSTRVSLHPGTVQASKYSLLEVRNCRTNNSFLSRQCTTVLVGVFSPHSKVF
jgi:hypothetical protein